MLNVHPLLSSIARARQNSEIMKLLKAARSTVYYTVTRFQELKSTEDGPRCGRARSFGRLLEGDLSGRQRSLMLSELESGAIQRDS